MAAGRSCMTIPPAIRSSLAAALGAALLLGCRTAEKDRLALVGATLIDGTGGPVREDVVIVVRGGEIDTVASRAGFKIPKTAITVDLTGRWIIPGLIDAHAHTSRWALARYLAYGVTTVRDAHGKQDSILALRDELGLNSIRGPRLFSAGAMIDGVPATYPDATPVANEAAARRAVDERAVAGVNYIKTYTRITPTLLRAILDEAGTLHLAVTSHLGLTDALTAARLGVKSIEHLSGVPEAAVADPAKFYAAHRQSFFAGWNYFERSWSAIDSASLSRVARALASAKVTLIPTLVLHETYSRLDDPAVRQSPDLKAVPDSVQKRWNVPNLIARAGWTTEDFSAFRGSRPAQDLFLREFRGAGGAIAAGTDADNQMLVPGASLHQELELLVNAGLTPEDALFTATRNAAALLGVDSLGRISPGRVADLVILSADPLRDIRNTRLIEQVMARGTLMSADSIRARW